jgi:mRNA interferase MazF
VVLDQLQSARTGWPSTGGSADAAAYSAKTGLMICCPMTTAIKGYPFAVLLASQAQSAVLADHVCWRARKAMRKGKISDAELADD